jgi:hypothetical protein
MKGFRERGISEMFELMIEKENSDLNKNNICNHIEQEKLGIQDLEANENDIWF